MATYTDTEIKDFVKTNASNGGIISKAMKDYGVGIGDIQKAGGWTDQQVSDYVGSYGDDAMKAAYAAYKNPAATGNPPGTTALPPPVPLPPPGAAPVTPSVMPAASPTPAPAAAAPNQSSIISSAVSAANSGGNAAAQGPSMTGVTSRNVNFNPANVSSSQTMEGILSRLVGNTETPWLKQARGLAMEGMAERGLQSSSLAQGAGVQAAITGAGEVAAHDSQLYAQQQMQNQLLGANVSMANADRSLAADTFSAGAKNTSSLAGFNAGQTRGNLLLDGSLDISKMNLSQQQELQKMQLGQDFDLAKMGVDQVNYMARLDKSLSGDLTKMSADQGYFMDRLTRGLDIDLTKMGKGQEFDLQKLAKDYDYDIGKMAEGLKNDVSLSKFRSELDEGSRTRLMQVEEKIGSSANGKASLVNSTSRYTQLVNSVRTDPNLDQAAKEGAIQDLRMDWEQETSRIATLYGVDLPADYVPPRQPATTTPATTTPVTTTPVTTTPTTTPAIDLP